MSDKYKRRAFLAGAIGLAVGSVAGFLAAVPSTPALQTLTRFWIRVARNPKELTNVEVDIRSLHEGESVATSWNDRAIYIIRRTKETISSIDASDMQLIDPNSDGSMQPNSAKNRLRSIRPEIFVVDAHCTHLGCSTKICRAGDNRFLPDGGFFCGCHGGAFDSAGRALAGFPPPQNLSIPPHYFKDNDTVVIGQDHA